MKEWYQMREDEVLEALGSDANGLSSEKAEALLKTHGENVLRETKKHYYTAGVSWSKGKTRVQLSYGRNRAGYLCSGGVCRYSPAYTGVNLLLTAAF